MSCISLPNEVEISKTNNNINLLEANTSQEYIIKDVVTNDEEIKKFLFTLGCFAGESITVMSILSDNYVVSVKDARYSIDTELAESIII